MAKRDKSRKEKLRRKQLRSAYQQVEEVGVAEKGLEEKPKVFRKENGTAGSEGSFVESTASYVLHDLRKTAIFVVIAIVVMFVIAVFVSETNMAERMRERVGVEKVEVGW